MHFTNKQFFHFTKSPSQLTPIPTVLFLRFALIFYFTTKQFLLMGVKIYFFVPGHRVLLPQNCSLALSLIQLLIIGPQLQKVAHPYITRFCIIQRV